jgi:hypothetical protein
MQPPRVNELSQAYGLPATGQALRLDEPGELPRARSGLWSKWSTASHEGLRHRTSAHPTVSPASAPVTVGQKAHHSCTSSAPML